MNEELLSMLDAALGFGETIVIVRSGAAIAEVMGNLRLRRGDEWLTLGEEEGSHVHVKGEDVRAIRYRQSEDRNAALEVLGPDGGEILRVSFRQTNPARADAFNAERLAAVAARFGHLAEVSA